MYSFCFALILLVAVTFEGITGFGVHPTLLPRHFGLVAVKSSSSALAAQPTLSDKFFQLEELEDKETCTTELYLNEDYTVAVGKTDGPLFTAASGFWEDDGEGNFMMTLVREYESGKDTKRESDMGEFKFMVERTFTGELSYVGASIAVTGTVHSVDALYGDREVGFFNLIDTTQERLGAEEEEDKEGDKEEAEQTA